MKGQRNSRVARKKLTKCQVFLGQANREHLCSMEPFRNLKAKRNPPRRTIDEAAETFLRFQKRSSKLVSRQEFQESGFYPPRGPILHKIKDFGKRRRSTKGKARSATGAKLQRSRVARKKLTKCQVFLGQAKSKTKFLRAVQQNK